MTTTTPRTGAASYTTRWDSLNTRLATELEAFLMRARVAGASSPG